MAVENASKFEKLLREDEALQAKMEAALKAFDGDKSDEKAVFDATVAPLAAEAGLPYTFEEAVESTEARELDDSELDAVAGRSRDWVEEGCASTVESGSSCWGEDGGCILINIHYDIMPCKQPCIFCGAKYTWDVSFQTNMSGGINYKYQCRECKKWFYYNSKHSQWEEYPLEISPSVLSVKTHPSRASK
jgi:hypothetical protein